MSILIIYIGDFLKLFLPYLYKNNAARTRETIAKYQKI